jgi:hypothetical protein
MGTAARRDRELDAARPDDRFGLPRMAWPLEAIANVGRRSRLSRSAVRSSPEPRVVTGRIEAGRPGWRQERRAVGATPRRGFLVLRLAMRSDSSSPAREAPCWTPIIHSINHGMASDLLRQVLLFPIFFPKAIHGLPNVTMSSNSGASGPRRTDAKTPSAPGAGSNLRPGAPLLTLSNSIPEAPEGRPDRDDRRGGAARPPPRAPALVSMPTCSPAY